MGHRVRNVLVATLIALCLSACGKHSERKSPEPAASASAPYEQKRLKVSYGQGFLHSVERTLPLVGTVVADKSVTVPSRATGQIVEVYVVQGERVSQGQILATVDTSDSRLAVRKSQAELAQELAVLGLKSPQDKLRSVDQVPSVIKAKATLENAKENLDRYEKLHREHLVSDVDYLQKKTAYVTAEADYRAALESVTQNMASVRAAQLSVAINQKKVTDAVVRAPVSGVVDEVTTAPGAYVSAGSNTGIVILKDRPLYVSLDVPQIHLAQLAVGKILTFKTPAYPDQTVTARVAQLGGRVNSNSGAIPARAEILSPPSWMVPGVSAEVELMAERLPDKLLVPQAAVLTQAGKSSVFVVASRSGDTATLKKVQVKVGQQSGDWVVVEGEVDPYQKLVTSDLLGLDDGGKVELGQEIKPEIPESLR